MNTAFGWIEPFTPSKRTAKNDALAGLPSAIASVPDGMASGLLAGVSPIHGLYASALGPIAGGALSSTSLMMVTTTSAAALAAASAVQSTSGADRVDALVLLTLLAGGLMVIAGIARLGRYTRFVSVSVMVGFLTGVAANIVFGQIPDFFGVGASGSTSIGKAFSVLAHPSQMHLGSAAVGATAIVLLYALASTRISIVASLIAIAVPSALAGVIGGVETVAANGPIPRGVPLPHLPALGALSVNVVGGAFAVMAIVLVQGAGVAESVPHHGPPANTNRDFIAQGAGNLASGLFSGQPVGASVGQTALNVSSGARSRWAAIFAGVWMLVILFAFAGVVGHVALPTLSALLIAAAISSFRLGEISIVLRSGGTSTVGFVTTFLATLLLPIAYAVAIGVAVSLLLQLNREALDLSVVELRPDDGGFEERDPPAVLADRQIIVLDVYGSLFYAGAKTLAARLPELGESTSPMVIIRLRGRTTLGTTALVVLADYARRLDEHGGHLFLSGVDHGLRRRFRLTADDLITIVPGDARLGASTNAAVDLARQLAEERDASGDDRAAAGGARHPE